MKKATLVWLGSAVMALALLATASWADEPDPVGPPDQGLSLVGVSQQFSASLDGARSGAANVTIKAVPYAVAIDSAPLAMDDLTDNYGRLVGTGATVIDFGDGNKLYTMDEVRFT